MGTLQPIYTDEMESPIGPLLLGATGLGLCVIEFGTDDEAAGRLARWAADRIGPARFEPNPDALAEARRQLSDYFAGRRRDFSLPLDLYGTPFQLRVWRALTQIPFGETRSYKDVAEAIGQPKAVRAVGGANNRNPIPVIVPCHRVIGANGSMVGYGGGLTIKTRLLDLEADRQLDYGGADT